MKKFISIFLAVLMIVTLLPLSAFAGGISEQKSDLYKDYLRSVLIPQYGLAQNFSSDDINGGENLIRYKVPDSAKGINSAYFEDFNNDNKDEMIIVRTECSAESEWMMYVDLYSIKNNSVQFIENIYSTDKYDNAGEQMHVYIMNHNNRLILCIADQFCYSSAGSIRASYFYAYEINSSANKIYDILWHYKSGTVKYRINDKEYTTSNGGFQSNSASSTMTLLENTFRELGIYDVKSTTSDGYYYINWNKFSSNAYAKIYNGGTYETIFSTDYTDFAAGFSAENNIIASGFSGDNQKWTLYTSGELVISGSGETTASGDVTDSIPWYDYCDQITTVIIEADVTDISPSAFYGENMTTFYVESDNAYYSSDENGILFNKDKTSLLSVPAATPLTEYTVPSSVTSVAGRAFSWNINLTDVVISDGITTIEHETFLGSNIQTVSIPASVTEIDWWAFDVCEQLHTVYYAGTEAQWNNIYIEQGNDYLTNAVIIFNTTDDQPGNDEHTEHNYVQTDKQEATCTQNGSITYTCSECGDSYTKTISKGHKFTKYEVIQEATPYQDGIWQKTCKRCNEKSQQKFKYNYPAYSDYPFVITTPEYVNVGDEFEVIVSFENLINKSSGYFFMHYDSDILEYIDCEFLFDTTDALTGDGHPDNDLNTIATYFMFINKSNIDTTELVKFRFRAINRGTVEFHAEQYWDFDSYWNYGKDIPLPGDATVTVLDDHNHSYALDLEFPTCTEPGHIIYNCSCGYSYSEEYLYATGHTPGEWVITTEATFNTNGLRQQKCSVCGEIVDKQIIPALNQSYDDGVTRFHLDMPYEVKAGDTFDIILSCSNIYGVSSGDILFRYKPQYLELVSAQTLLNADLNSQGIDEEDGGITEAFVYSQKCTEQHAQIAKYTFRALQDGECYVEVYTESWENATAPLDLGATITINPDKILCETGHTPGEWVVTEEATDTANGLKQQMCTVCGMVLDSQIIPSLNQSYDDGIARFQIATPTEVELGETFDIVLSCSDVYGFEAGVVKFSYKTNMLELVSSETLFDADVSRQFIDEDEGLITEAFVFVDHCKEQNAQIAKYTFRALQAGECYVEVYTNDWEGSPIPLDMGTIIAIDTITQDQEVSATGDVNGDGKLTASDARAALRMSAKLETYTPEQFAAADVNKDGKLTASDARIILRVSAKLQTF